jgi:hypothetical protein
MQEHPLIGLGEVQGITDLLRRPPQGVPEPDHLGLHRREARDLFVDDVERLLPKKAILRDASPIVMHRRPSAARLTLGLVESRRIEDGGVQVVAGEGGERKAPPFTLPTCLRDVREDPEDPGPQGGSAFEALESPKDSHPGLLYHLFGHRRRRDVHTGDAEHRRLELVDEIHERRLVSGSQSLDEGEILGDRDRFGHDPGAYRR